MEIDLQRLYDILVDIGDLQVVTGDAIHRVNPSSRQVVNSTCSWLVSDGNEKSAHRLQNLALGLKKIKQQLEVEYGY